MLKSELLANKREEFQNLWWVRCLLATEFDRLGLILRSAFACPTDKPPWLGPSAIIDRDGIVLSNFVDNHNKMHFAEVVCEINELLGNLNRLADQLDLRDHERIELFEKIRQWIKADARPTTEQAEDRLPRELIN